MNTQYSDVVDVINKNINKTMQKVDKYQDAAQTYLQQNNYSSEYRQECAALSNAISQEKNSIENYKQNIFDKFTKLEGMSIESIEILRQLEEQKLENLTKIQELEQALEEARKSGYENIKDLEEALKKLYALNAGIDNSIQNISTIKKEIDDFPASLISNSRIGSDAGAECTDPKLLLGEALLKCQELSEVLSSTCSKVGQFFMKTPNKWNHAKTDAEVLINSSPSIREESTNSLTRFLDWKQNKESSLSLN